MTKPSQSLCSDKVYYVLVFYYFIHFLVGFYSTNAIFIGWAKYAIVKINNEFTEKFDVQTGVKQVDPLSDTFFSIAMDSILKKMELRANISTRLKQCTAYVDDILITTRTTQAMIDTFIKLKNESLKYGLIVNGHKTKCRKHR